MATHSSILAWRITMDRGAWWAVVHGGCKESDTTEWLSTAQHMVALGFFVAQLVKNPPALQEAPVQLLGWEDPLEMGKATHSVFLGFSAGSAGKESSYNVGDLGVIPGLGRSPGEGKGYPLQCSCLGESPWTEEPGRLQSTRPQRVGHDWAAKNSTEETFFKDTSGMKIEGWKEIYCL